MNREYVDTVRLLLAIAPAVFRSPLFAMKGGTALNLFLHDMPRLSVDIDVVFTDYTLSREDALLTIAADLKTAKSEIAKSGLRASLPTTKSGDEVKLIVEGDGLHVKVEVNFVFRGTVLPVTPPTNAGCAKALYHRHRPSHPRSRGAIRQQACRRDGSATLTRHVRCLEDARALPNAIAPSSTKGVSFAYVRFHTQKPTPAANNRRTIGSPIAPIPRNAAFSTGFISNFCAARHSTSASDREVHHTDHSNA